MHGNEGNLYNYHLELEPSDQQFLPAELRAGSGDETKVQRECHVRQVARDVCTHVHVQL